MNEVAAADTRESSRPSVDSRLAIVGLGYVGLPLAINFTEAGLSVWGIDAWDARVTQIAAGSSPIDDVSDERLAAARRGGLTVTGLDVAAVSGADAVVICVPTPIDQSRDPDLTHILDAAQFVAKGCAADNWSSCSRRPIPARLPARFARRSKTAAAWSQVMTSTWRSYPSA